MKIEIIDKLYSFFNHHSPISEECEAVYLMVELRKLLDREKEDGSGDLFPLIRFYADWTVHTRKDRNTRHIHEIMARVDDNLNPFPKNGDLSFLSMPHLKGEMLELFNKYGFPNAIFEPNNWLNFATILSQVLADQPIINPTEHMSAFNYANIGNAGIMATIDFNDGRGCITLGGVSEVV